MKTTPELQKIFIQLDTIIDTTENKKLANTLIHIKYQLQQQLEEVNPTIEIAWRNSKVDEQELKEIIKRIIKNNPQVYGINIE